MTPRQRTKVYRAKSSKLSLKDKKRTIDKCCPLLSLEEGFCFTGKMQRDSIHKHMNNSYREKQRDLAQ